MELDSLTILGLIAGALTTIAYVPQLVKTWRSKSAGDLSWSMLVTLCTGIILWLVYGFYARDIPVIAANLVTLVLSSIILMLKIRYRSGAIEPDSYGAVNIPDSSST